MNDRAIVTPPKDEPDQRVIHRLEAFSDIVIGFSLAQLALSLAIPHDAARGLLAKPEPLIAFALTFAIVCSMWWAHHRLFTHYFVPVTPMIVLNFVTLACISFTVYSVQLMLHTPHSSIDFAFYLGSLAAVYTLLSVQFLYGWRVRRNELPEGIAEHGLRSGALMAGVALAAGVVAVLTERYGLRAQSIQYLGFVIIAYGITLRLFFRARNAKRVPGASPPAPQQDRS